ncbi:MAG: putative membrane protein, partial [Acidimicrobiales bacterium]
ALLVHAVRKMPASTLLILPLCFTLMASGFIDVLVTNDQATSPWPLTAMDSAGVAVGEWARTTDTNSVFVIELGWAPGQASPHQHPVPALSGRQVLVGNDGWVYDLGIDDWSVRKDHSRIILEAGAGYRELIDLYDVDYLVLGPNTRTPNWDPNTIFWEEAADVVYRHGGWTVYEV